jgi:1-aminocyclopropane-1-carboxylate deaminase
MMQEIELNNISVDVIAATQSNKNSVEVSVLRLDKIHSLISGNKWFKLRYYIEDALKQNKKTILTFGGAWSNHILATAAACNLYKLNSIGIIRGEEPQQLSYTLEQARKLGMKLVFSSREDYRHGFVPEELNEVDHYLVNEGGYGDKGAAGAATILDYCDTKQYTHICCAAGTGTMMAGLIQASLPSNTIIGISVLKNNSGLEEKIRSLLPVAFPNFQIIHDYHFGGYAKYKPELINFMNEYFSRTNIPSDFVYTGKLFFAINDLINADYFAAGSKLLIIHSGGLQGNASLEKGTLIF